MLAREGCTLLLTRPRSTMTIINSLLPQVIEDCEKLMPGSFIFQQDGAPAHTARQTQEWLALKSPEMINKDEWPPNSPDLNPLDYYVWGAMLHMYQKYTPKPTNKKHTNKITIY